MSSAIGLFWQPHGAVMLADITHVGNDMNVGDCLSNGCHDSSLTECPTAACVLQAVAMVNQFAVSLKGEED